MKLELKHLAPYLPYGLKIQTIGLYEDEPYFIMSTRYKIKEILIHDVIEYQDKYFKPILRPLSDLTKEIEHNGEKFVPLNEIKNLELYSHYELEDFVRNNFSYGNIDSLSYQLLNQLLEWHFDVFDLHSKGLCIYYNEL